MLSIHKQLITLLLIAFTYTAKPQDLNGHSLTQIEDSLSILIQKVASNNSSAVKEEANNNFLTLFRSALNKEDAFEYPFDSLKNIGKIKSNDGKLRIFTWNLPYSGGFQKYFGFILYKNDKKNTLVFELDDNRKSLTDPIKEIMGKHNWMGALYYSVLEHTLQNKTYYTLLGFDFNSLFSSKKIVEVLSFGSDNEPIFGANIFKVDNDFIARVVFEFSARATMTLRYIPDSQTIVF